LTPKCLLFSGPLSPKQLRQREAELNKNNKQKNQNCGERGPENQRHFGIKKTFPKVKMYLKKPAHSALHANVLRQVTRKLKFLVTQTTLSMRGPASLVKRKIF
jgi:hypothetical protein